MTKRIRTTKTTTRRYRKHANVKTRKRTIRSKTKKTRQRGGMFKAVVDSVLSRFQGNNVNDFVFVDKLRTILNFNTNSEIKATLIKDLMRDNKEQINNVIWVTMSNGRYTIHESNKRLPGAIPLLLFQILYNVPDFKRNRSIYHAFLDNGGDMDKKINPNGFSLKDLLPSDFDPVDERKKQTKKGKKSKKPKSSAPAPLMQIIEENVDDEGPIESVVDKPEQVEMEEDIVKSDIGLVVDDIQLDVEPITEERTTLPLATGASYDTTLTFWTPLFPGNELSELRSKFESLIESDKELKHDELCKLCEFVKTIIPSFHISFESVKNINGLTVFKRPKDIQNINIILCATMLLLGVIAKKLEKQDYTFMYKGGKGVQLAFAYAGKKYGKMFEDYESEDIDLIIIPNKKNVSYNFDKANELALNISYLIRWFFESNYKDNLDSQIMPTNPNVVKFAYQASVGNKTALMDIDFSNIPDENRPFYDDKIKMFHKKTDGSLSEDMLFYFQSLEQQINEKLYYYLLYTKYKMMLQHRPVIEITDEKYKKLTVRECNNYLTKFNKSLLALLRGYGEGYLSFFDKYKMDSRFSEVLTKVQTELTK